MEQSRCSHILYQPISLHGRSLDASVLHSILYLAVMILQSQMPLIHGKLCNQSSEIPLLLISKVVGNISRCHQLRAFVARCWNGEHLYLFSPVLTIV
jgi:hypothetical protein